MKRSLAVLLLLAAVATAGCSAPTAAKDCGAENQGHGQGYNADVRNCLWLAYLDKQPATFSTTILTTEGDPITTTVTVDARGRVTVVRDTTKDKFGEQKITSYSCQSLERPDIDPGPGRRADFIARGCSGGENREIGF